jgi:hypothetical protein
MTIKSVQILEGFGPDYLYLETDLPEGFATGSNQSAHLGMQVTKGKAKEYCELHFPNIPVTVVTRPRFLDNIKLSMRDK